MTFLASLVLGLLLTPLSLGVSPELDALLQSYFRSCNPGRRAELADSIEELTGGDLTALAEARHRVQLWDFQAAEDGRFLTPSDSGPTIIGTYQLPSGYDPRRRYPVIVCMPEDEYGDRLPAVALPVSVPLLSSWEAPTMMSSNPSPFTSPAPLTE